MIEAPVHATLDAQQVAAIHLQIPVADMRTAFPTALEELSRALDQQNIAPAGPIFTHHFRRPTDTFDFLACIPVTQPVLPSGRVEPVSMPPLSILRTTYHGDYTGLPHAWGDFMAVIQPSAPALRGDFVEAYIVGPGQSTDPANWRTELSIILAPQQGAGA